jgi:hypothetical protein
MVRVGSLEVHNDADISASTFGIGKGGDLTITAADILLHSGSTISAISFGAGESGAISITALNDLRLFNDSRISVATTQANAGDINLNVGFLLHLRDGSITTSVAGSQGDGGNIFIDPVFTVLDGGSQIVAQAQEGQGSDIRIVSDLFFQSPDSLIDASSEFGVSGTVEIDSPDTNIMGGLTELPAGFFDAATVLTKPCAERSGAEVSRLVVRQYEVLPDSPYALRVRLPKAVPGVTGRVAGQHYTLSTRGHPTLVLTCPGDGQGYRSRL